MAITFDFFTDTGLTSPAATPLLISHNTDFSDNPQDFQFFLGSATAGLKIQATSNPGIDNIVISAADTSPASGHETTEIKLATTQGGLTAATPGASLTVGTTVNSGAASDFEFWMRVTNAVAVVGTSSELSITTNNLTETVI